VPWKAAPDAAAQEKAVDDLLSDEEQKESGVSMMGWPARECEAAFSLEAFSTLLGDHRPFDDQGPLHLPDAAPE
jgi:hypothetical protein